MMYRVEVAKPLTPDRFTIRLMNAKPIRLCCFIQSLLVRFAINYLMIEFLFQFIPDHLLQELLPTPPLVSLKVRTGVVITVNMIIMLLLVMLVIIVIERDALLSLLRIWAIMFYLLMVVIIKSFIVVSFILRLTIIERNAIFSVRKTPLILIIIFLMFVSIIPLSLLPLVSHKAIILMIELLL